MAFLNLADLATRGITTSELSQFSLWWQGPSFLEDSASPHSCTNEIISNDDCHECRKVSHAASKTFEPWDLLFKYSLLRKLLRITALYIRFVNNIRSHKKTNLIVLTFLHRFLRGNECWAILGQIIANELLFQRLRMLIEKSIIIQEQLFNQAKFVLWLVLRLHSHKRQT